MNKKLIQQLLDDSDTLLAIANTFAMKVDSDTEEEFSYDVIMQMALNQLNNTLVKGDMITIEVSDHMYVRGEYVRTEPGGQVAVNVVGPFNRFYAGKRVELVVKGEEGRGKPDLVGTGVQKGIIADAMIAERERGE